MRRNTPPSTCDCPSFHGPGSVRPGRPSSCTRSLICGETYRHTSTLRTGSPIDIASRSDFGRERWLPLCSIVRCCQIRACARASLNSYGFRMMTDCVEVICVPSEFNGITRMILSWRKSTFRNLPRGLHFRGLQGRQPWPNITIFGWA